MTTHFFYISNLVAKGSGLNLCKKLNNLLSNREALNFVYFVYFSSPKETCFAMQCNDFCLCYRIIVVKKRFIYSNLFIYTINTKKLCLSYEFINKMCHDMIYCIQIVSEKAFCHSQISMISLQNVLVTF